MFLDQSYIEPCEIAISQLALIVQQPAYAEDAMEERHSDFYLVVEDKDLQVKETSTRAISHGLTKYF